MTMLDPPHPKEASVAPRPPQTVMRLARMGAAHPFRLSFLRVMLRRMAAEGWRFDRPVWDLDARGVGRAVYRATGPDRTYSLVAFAHDLPDEMRSDRVIATAWDATFALFDGMPSSADLDRLQANVPLQEAGRISGRELSLSRANRSVRLWSHVVAALAEGRQPDPAEIAAVGYLMRTTAVYGAGKFGAADWSDIAGRPELSVPFQAEMLSVWLTRQFTVDIVEHLARAKGGQGAVRLSREIRESLGVGNSTGLGMAPYLVRHPVLLNNWIAARETALARVRSLSTATEPAVEEFKAAWAAAVANAGRWRSQHPIQTGRLADLRRDLSSIGDRLATFPGDAPRPWDALWRWGEGALSLEGQEALLAILLEPHGALIDDLAQTMAADEAFGIDGAMTLDALRAVLAASYDWALAIDFSDPAQQARFWYVSEEKLEPRLGERATEAGAEREQPLCVGRLASELDAALAAWPADATVAAFLLRHPEHRYMVRRAQIAATHPYSEVRDNLIAADVLPIDLMRCKLAFFGASHFDPRSDKWVRISLFQGAPYPLDIPAEPDPAGAAAAPLSDAPAPLRRAPEVALSRNEIETLCTKAARGTGFSWGLAEEAGRAAAWLHAQGLDGAAALLAHLERAGDQAGQALPAAIAPGHWTAAGGVTLCPVALGASLVDFGGVPAAGGRGLALGPVGRPLMLLPFLAALSLARQTALSLSWDGGQVWLDGAGSPSGDLAALADLPVAMLHLACDPGTVAAAAPRLARGCDGAVADRLGLFALRTTVPPSAKSREDAGAGTSDND